MRTRDEIAARNRVALTGRRVGSGRAADRQPGALRCRALGLRALLGLIPALSACLEPFPTPPTLRRPSPARGIAVVDGGHGQRATAAAAARDAAAPPQDEAAAWRLICAAEERAGVDPTQSRGDRAGQVAEWIVAHVTNKRARLWWIELDKIERRHQPAALAAAAARAGVDDCRLATLLFGAPTNALAAAGADGGVAQRPARWDAR